MRLRLNREKTIPVTETGCLLWLGATTPAGYGKVGTNAGVFEYAHRLAYFEAYGPIPDGMLVCHKCDTPPCCEPTHLFLGSPSDNVADMVRKGRHVPIAKLTDADVAAIQSMAGVKCSDIAATFGITEKHASAVRTGHAYKKRKYKGK